MITLTIAIYLVVGLVALPFVGRSLYKGYKPYYWQVEEVAKKSMWVAIFLCAIWPLALFIAAVVIGIAWLCDGKLSLRIKGWLRLLIVGV